MTAELPDDIRTTALKLVAQIEPAEFRERCVEIVDATNSMPAQITKAVAAETDVEDVTTRAASTHLYYAGLYENRRLIRDNPWTYTGGDEEMIEQHSGDIDILASEVLVGKAFTVLAGTPAGKRAPAAIRSFATAETLLRERSTVDLEAELEKSTVEVAVAAGMGDGETDELVELLSEDILDHVGREYTESVDLQSVVIEQL